MPQNRITKASFDFLKQLQRNNNREWFTNHKDAFKKHEQTTKQFYESVMDNLRKHDEIEKMKMFRIYRDVRFSKDKTPYKTHFSGSFSRAGARLRGGYYLHLQPGGSLVATGFWAPNKDDLLRIRREMEVNADEFRNTINDKKLKAAWGTLQGDEVKTAPKGFDREHPDIDLIRKKQYIFVKNFTDKEVLAPDFEARVDQAYRAIRPFFDFMSLVLTTNLNGESLID